MAWVTPVTDRTAADVTARNAKAFLNVADWVRIDGNTTVVQAQILSLLGVTVTLTDLTAPAITDFPDVADINSLAENIDLLRIASGIPASTGMLEITHDYQAGPAATVPNYVTVNAWENDLLLIYTLLPKTVETFVYCGVAGCGQSHLWQARFRG
jgi:hypothetical protein